MYLKVSRKCALEEKSGVQTSSHVGFLFSLIFVLVVGSGAVRCKYFQPPSIIFIILFLNDDLTKVGMR